MMRGRQIGNWVNQRQTAPRPRPENWSSENPPPKRRSWRITRLVLLLTLIALVAWWLRREGGYRRFMSSLREGTVQYVEYQPYPNSAFVKVTQSKGIRGVADWLADARPVDSRYGALPAADCEMRIVMSDGSIKRLWLSSSGPRRSGGTLVPINTYLLLKGDGWQRVTFGGGLGSVYLGLPVSAQLPFTSVPTMPATFMPPGIAPPAATATSEVDPSEAQNLLERGQLGQARRMLARAIVADGSNGIAQQLMADVQARLRIVLPQSLRELERDIPVSAKLEREKYLNLREKLLEATLMADPADPKIAQLHQKLTQARPDPRVDQFIEILRLGRSAQERYTLRDFAWSPDGAAIAACGDDGRVRLWDTISGTLLESFAAVPAGNIHFSADGQKVWLWNDQARTWWDLTSGKQVQEQTPADDARQFEFRVYANGLDTVGVTRNKDGELLAQLVGHAGSVKLAKLSPDGDQIASFGDDKVLCIWGDAPGRLGDLSPAERFVQLRRLEGPSVFLKDGSILTFRSGKVYPAPPPRKQLKVIALDAPGMITRLTFASDGERGLAEMSQAKLLVVEAAKTTARPLAAPENSCGHFAIAPDGKTIAIGNLDGSVRLLNAQTGETIASLTCTPTRNRNWATVEFSSDGGWVMACGVGFVTVWNVSSREQVFYSDKAATDGIAAAFTPDGKALAITYREGGLRLLKSNLKESEALGWDQVALRDPTFSKNARWIAAIGKGGEIELFDAGANNLAHIPIRASTKHSVPLLFNDDGSILLIKADDGSARLVEVPTGRALRRLTISDEPNWLQMPCSFSPDAKYLIAGPMVWGME